MKQADLWQDFWRRHIDIRIELTLHKPKGDGAQIGWRQI